MTAVAASVFLFLAVVGAAASLVLGPGRLGRNLAEERLRGLRSPQRDPEPRHAAAPAMRRSHSSIPTLRRWLGGSPWAEETARELQQANVQLRVGEYLLIRLLLAAVAVLLLALLMRFEPVGLLIALAAGVLAFFAPAFYVKLARRRRLAQIERQLVELLPLLASSLRAGFALQQAMEGAAQQIGPPLADELTLLLRDVNLGATMQSALQEMSEKVCSPDLDIIVTAILVQRMTGGNLAEVLDHGAETLRERERIRGEILTFTSQQRLTGTVLSVYPIVVGLILLALMPAQWSKLFTEGVGQVQLIAAVSLQVIGFLAIRRILRIEI